MERVEKDQVWSFMCPDESPKLNLVYGEEKKKIKKDINPIKELTESLRVNYI
jgi:hypothetical protein